MVSGEPQPGFDGACFKGPESVILAPKEPHRDNRCDEDKIFWNFSVPLLEIWARLRSEKEMLRLVREYLRGALVERISKKSL